MRGGTYLAMARASAARKRSPTIVKAFAIQVERVAGGKLRPLVERSALPVEAALPHVDGDARERSTELLDVRAAHRGHVLARRGRPRLTAVRPADGVTDDLGPAPSLDLEAEQVVQIFVREAIRQGLLQSAHDCSEGGLAVAIAECCIAGGLGFRARMSVGSLRHLGRQVGRSARIDANLFGEGQSRFIISCKPDNSQRVLTLFASICEASDARWTKQSTGWGCGEIGVVGGDAFVWPDEWSGPLISVPVKELARAWNTPF